MLDKDFGNCCRKCQLFQVCETKWYRGERGEEQVCCNVDRKNNPVLEKGKNGI